MGAHRRGPGRLAHLVGMVVIVTMLTALTVAAFYVATLF